MIFTDKEIAAFVAARLAIPPGTWNPDDVWVYMMDGPLIGQFRRCPSESTILRHFIPQIGKDSGEPFDYYEYREHKTVTIGVPHTPPNNGWPPDMPVQATMDMVSVGVFALHHIERGTRP